MPSSPQRIAVSLRGSSPDSFDLVLAPSPWSSRPLVVSSPTEMLHINSLSPPPSVIDNRFLKHHPYTTTAWIVTGVVTTADSANGPKAQIGSVL